MQDVYKLVRFSGKYRSLFAIWIVSDSLGTLSLPVSSSFLPPSSSLPPSLPPSPFSSLLLFIHPLPLPPSLFLPSPSSCSFIHCPSLLPPSPSSLLFLSHSPELQLGDTDKPLKLLSSWGKLLREYASTRSSTEEVPSLYLRRNVFFPLSTEKMVGTQLLLCFADVYALFFLSSSLFPSLLSSSLFMSHNSNFLPSPATF